MTLFTIPNVAPADLMVNTANAAADNAHSPWTGHDTQVLIIAAIGIAIVVLLIVWLKMHAFLALTIASLFVGIGSGIALEKVPLSFETGVGGVLGYVGVLIALGAMLEVVRRDLVERQGFRRRVFAGLAGARATAMVLALLPAVGVGLGQLMGAAPLRVLLGGGAGGLLLVAGVFLDCAGLLWAERIGQAGLR